jgi:tripartite-type tricarboxylate transporter receptor subunit TctC
MKKRLALLSSLLAFALSASALAQGFPAKPVRMVVGIAPGGGLDAATRLVSGKMSEVLGTPFVVENRPGAGGTLAAAAVAKSPADGYTLFFGATTLMIVSHMYENLPFDPVRSFTAIGGAGAELLVVVVNPNVPAKTTAELIALLKAHPGKYSYGSPGIGTLHHMAMEMFAKQAGVKMTHVPYKGAALVTPDLINGTLPIAIMSVASTINQAKAGKLRPIAISSPVKLPIAPDWRPLADTLPGFDASSSRYVLAPAGTPPEVVGRLSSAMRTAVLAEDVQANFLRQGGTADFVPPDEVNRILRTDTPKWGVLVKETGAKAE